MTQVYREQYGREPVIETIHAGVECGIFSEKLPGLDCVSFGPDLTDIPHRGSGCTLRPFNGRGHWCGKS